MVNFLKIKDTFCVLPWVHLFIHNTGELKVCLVSQLSLVKDDNSRDFNVSDINDLDAIMNSKVMKKIRLNMLKGIWNKTCNRCKEPEKAGGCMERIWFNNFFKNDILRLIRNTREDGSIDPRVLFLDIRLGNACNLSCKMCFPYTSDKCLHDIERIYPEKKEYLKRFKEIGWLKDPAAWNKIYGLIPNLKYVSIAGGEPMIIPEAAKFLEKCTSLGYSRNIVVRYSTNATIIMEGIEKVWREFAKIRLVCSIDGFGEMNNYIRYPSNWKAVDHNLKEFNRYHRDFNLELVQINTCVHVINVFYLDELYGYLTSGGFDFVSPAPMLSAVDNPEYLNCKILPLEIKEEAKNYLIQTREKYRSKIPGRYHRNLNYFDYIIDNMYLEQRDDLLPVFIDTNERFDRLRKQDILKVAPKLKELMNERE